MSGGAGGDLRADAIEKVTGAARFVTDLAVPGMLHGRILRSPIPHGRIVRVDAGRALALPGVRAVLTGADLAGLAETHWGLYLRDRPVIAVDRVRYVGEPVAAVAAESELLAEEALELVDVEYAPLPFVTDPEAALAPDAPLVHDRFDRLEDFYFRGATSPVPGTNVFQRYRYEHGDVEAALATAARVFEDHFAFPMVYHYAMEPHAAAARTTSATSPPSWCAAPCAPRRRAWEDRMGAERLEIACTVNGTPQRLDVECRELLIDVLREMLGLLGTKRSCDVEVCGACTVLLDGAPVSACTTLAGEADGREVLTIEGLARDGVLDPVQEAFARHGAFQCGFCTPGMILAVKALLAERAAPTEAEIRHYLRGNLCRCTGYVKILDAVRSLV